MFISYRHHSHNSKTEEYEYTLTDSEFGSVIVVETSGRFGSGLAREYEKRGYSDKEIGKNLALYSIWFSKVSGWALKQIVEWQDKDFPKYIPDWKKYITFRDEYLEKINLLK